MKTALTTAERQTAISQHLGIARPLGDTASDLADQFREWAEEAKTLSPDQEAYLLAQLMVQVSGRLAQLHGNR